MDDLGRGEGWQQLVRSHVPLGRAGTGEDIAHIVVYLCSDEGAWVTGQSWNVDGGERRPSTDGDRPRTLVTPGIGAGGHLLHRHEPHVWKGGAVNESETTVRDGDVIEFTLAASGARPGDARTDDGLALLDLFDGDRPTFAPLSLLEDVAVFSADPYEFVSVG